MPNQNRLTSDAKSLPAENGCSRPELTGFSEADKLHELRGEERLKHAPTTVDDRLVLLDLAEDAILMLNLAGEIEFWNRGAEDMYGWRKEEALGRNVHELLRTEFPMPLQAIKSTVAAEGRWRGDLKQFRRDGSAVEISSRWALRKHNGVPHGWLEINRDITERKRLEAHLRETDKMESLGVLAGGVAHDFNNLLTAIMGNLEVAMGMTETGSPVTNLLDRCLRASQQAAMLTRHLLAYVGKGQFVIQPVDLNAALRSTVHLIGNSIWSEIRLDLNLADPLPRVKADESQLEQLVMNLILNAVEAIGQRPGTIAVTTSKRAVDAEMAKQRCDVGQLATGTYVELDVGDTGVGVDAGMRVKIFDPFFTTKFTGRGLGLAAVSGIVRALNGAIRVESEPGTGARFQIFFPAIDEDSSAKHEDNPQALILVVDDEQVVREAVETMLRSSGYDVLLASNGQQAVDLFRRERHRFALVLLDWIMPVMSGEATLRELKAIRPDIPVVISTAFAEEKIARRVGDLPEGFIQKPFTLAPLVRVISRVLQR